MWVKKFTAMCVFLELLKSLCGSVTPLSVLTVLASDVSSAFHFQLK